MSNSIAEYYEDEIAGWSESINFNNTEIDDFEQKLEAVIRRNSIHGIAEKVEKHQLALNNIFDKFFSLQIELQEQEASLKTDSTLIDNAAISQEMEKKQQSLRQKMQAVEKEYIDVKFNCYEFLSGILKS
jgi:hypothetical protein